MTKTRSLMKLKNFIHMLRCHKSQRTSRLGKAHSPEVRAPHSHKLFPTFGDIPHPEWTKSTFSQRKAHVEVLLESLEHRDAEIRFTNARRLLYILQGESPACSVRTEPLSVMQGTFAETSSPEDQLAWIFENCRVVRAANGISSIVEAIKIASSKHDLLWYQTMHCYFQAIC